MKLNCIVVEIRAKIQQLIRFVWTFYNLLFQSFITLTAAWFSLFKFYKIVIFFLLLSILTELSSADLQNISFYKILTDALFTVRNWSVFTNDTYSKYYSILICYRNFSYCHNIWYQLYKKNSLLLNGLFSSI